MSLCGNSIEIELPDGTVEDLNCTMPLDHPEAHSCRVWWHNDDPERAMQDGQ